MASSLSPYLSFRGKAREAMEFYQTVFGGKLDIMTFADMNAVEDPAEADLVMHSSLVADNGICILGSDAPMRIELNQGNTVSLSLMGDDEAELSGYFQKLSQGGTVTMPLEKAMWGDTFGMCTDKYGNYWMVNIDGGTATRAN